MNSLMNPRRMTTASLSAVCTIIFAYPFEMISLVWHTIRLSTSSRTLFTTPESYRLAWPASVVTFVLPFLTQYWCFHELELTNFQIMNSFSLVLFISPVRNDRQASLYWSVMISIIWALQDCAIFIILSMTNKDESKGMLNEMKVKEPETWLSQTSRSQLCPSSSDLQCMPDHL